MKMDSISEMTLNTDKTHYDDIEASAGTCIEKRKGNTTKKNKHKNSKDATPMTTRAGLQDVKDKQNIITDNKEDEDPSTSHDSAATTDTVMDDTIVINDDIETDNIEDTTLINGSFHSLKLTKQDSRKAQC
ncbi:hypothetical protein BD770DRAFT_449462 [Pilaira anomala]|nr:hypothetical protein BD770DRAFT_449462 [Pilaira anomala]